MLIKDTKFTIMCDVTNPLCGDNGATYTFGRQKGGTPEILEQLENGMQNYRDVIIRQFGINANEIQGIGERCKTHSIPAVGLCGSLGTGAEQIYFVYNKKLFAIIQINTHSELWQLPKP